MEKRIDYVAGFLFNQNRDRVVLILKNRPEWQKGLWNGVGGKIEANESPAQAMRREFQQEAGPDIEDWRLFCRLHIEGGSVFFFMASHNTGVATMEDEQIQWHEIKNGTVAGITNHIPNLRWLIPMALDKDRIFSEAQEGR